MYINRSEGFIGTVLRKEEFVEECSDIDDVIVFFEEGNMHVTKIERKKFVAINTIHAAVFRKKGFKNCV